MKQLITGVFMGICFLVFPQKTQISFDVFHNEENIGTLQAIKIKNGKKTVKDLRTNTNAKVLMMSIHVESEINTVSEEEILIKGIAYRHANRGTEDIQATVTKKDSKNYEAERNGVKKKIVGNVINYCVIDLYFKEPVGLSKIFSNMYADFLPIKKLEQGHYVLTTPDSKTSHYYYTNGNIERIEVEISLGKVISKRK